MSRIIDLEHQTVLNSVCSNFTLDVEFAHLDVHSF